MTWDTSLKKMSTTASLGSSLLDMGSRIRKFILALTGIHDARGVSVQGLGSRAGHRSAAANGQVQRGGKREKKVST
jgi:hypothetical protein